MYFLLPRDIQVQILDHLDCTSIVVFFTTCKTLYNELPNEIPSTVLHYLNDLRHSILTFIEVFEMLSNLPNHYSYKPGSNCFDVKLQITWRHRMTNLQDAFDLLEDINQVKLFVLENTLDTSFLNSCSRWIVPQDVDFNIGSRYKLKNKMRWYHQNQKGTRKKDKIQDINNSIVNSNVYQCKGIKTHTGSQMPIFW
jgi:hypothetical protein